MKLVFKLYQHKTVCTQTAPTTSDKDLVSFKEDMHNIKTDVLYYSAVQAYPPSCPKSSVGIQCKLQGCISDVSTQTSIFLLHQVQGVFNHLALSLRLLNLRRYLNLLSQLMTRVNYRKLGKCNYRLQFTSYLLNFNRWVNNQMISVPSAQQKKHLLFESALLLLFNLCIYCGSTSTRIRKMVTGTFLRITQKCMRCSRVRV